MTPVKVLPLWSSPALVSVTEDPFLLCCQVSNDKEVGENSSRNCVSPHGVLRYKTFMKLITSHNMQIKFNNNTTKKCQNVIQMHFLIVLNNGKIQTTSNTLNCNEKT